MEELELLKTAVSYTLECAYDFSLSSEYEEEREKMRSLLNKLNSGRWMLTPVPWEEEV